MPLTDMFWGNRYGQLVDPFGHTWSVATHKEDVSPEEMKQRGQEMFAQDEAGQAVTWRRVPITSPKREQGILPKSLARASGWLRLVRIE